MKRYEQEPECRVETDLASFGEIDSFLLFSDNVISERTRRRVHTHRNANGPETRLSIPQSRDTGSLLNIAQTNSRAGKHYDAYRAQRTARCTKAARQIRELPSQYPERKQRQQRCCHA